MCLCVSPLQSHLHVTGRDKKERQPLFSALRKPLQCHGLESKIENGTLGADVAKPTMAKMPLRLMILCLEVSTLGNHIYLVIELFAKLAMSLGKMGHYSLL